jgi:L-histidine Nalpha-methyltransferase / hercynylcysteine S-oxide synthase
VPTKDEDWPAVTSIIEFQSRVRKRLFQIYDDIDAGKRTLTRHVGRVLFMTYEHEALHLETLLYMLLQRSGTGTIPPPGFIPPNWESLAEGWDEAPLPKESSVILGPETVTIGHDDFEEEDAKMGAEGVGEHEYGWDNEHPKREIEVGKFRIDVRPITNGEFYEFYVGEAAKVWKGKEKVQLPASWLEKDGEIHVSFLFF